MKEARPRAFYYHTLTVVHFLDCVFLNIYVQPLLLLICLRHLYFCTCVHHGHLTNTGTYRIPAH